MKIKSILFVLFGLFTLQASIAEVNFSKEQIKEIEGIVHDYLIASPEVLIEASKALQEKQQQEMLAKAQAEIPKYASNIFNSSTSPVLGNPNGNIYLVEFLDYACGHCRKMHSIINKLVEANKSLKVVIKEFPIFGGASDYAAKMALAANKHGKYSEFHESLMKVDPPLTNDKVDDIARKLKLDLIKLKEQADSDEVNQEMQNNLELAQKIGIIGTPAFIVASNVGKDSIQSYFLPGSSSYEVLNSVIKKASN